MKLPNTRVGLVRIFNSVLTSLGIPEWMICMFRKEIADWKAWQESEQEWIEHTSFASSVGIPLHGPGLYYYYNKKTGEIVYYGWSSNVHDRTSSGKTVARTKLKEGTARNNKKYPGVEKMIDEDSNLENWGIMYMPTFSNTIAKHEETRLIYRDKPKYNKLGAAGTG